MAFEYAYDLGNEYPVILERDVLDATHIIKGELVKLLTPAASVLGGRVVPLTGVFTSIAGVAAHDKAANDGKVKMKFYGSPSACFKVNPLTTTAVTADSSAGVWGSTDLISGTTTGSDELLNGGKLKITAKAANSTITKNVGDVVDITAYDAVSSATADITVAVGTPITGDTGLIFPPIGAKLVIPTVTDTDHSLGIVLPGAGVAAGTCLVVVDHDLENNKVIVKIAGNVHQLNGHA